MIETGKIKKEVKQTGYGKVGDLAVGEYEFPGIDQLVHPVAGKGENIPGQNEPQENLERCPAPTAHSQPVDPEKEITHSGDKENMANFMGNEPFGPTMLLDRRCRVRPEYKKDEQKKIKRFVILQEKYSTFPYRFKLPGHYLTQLKEKNHIFMEYLPNRNEGRLLRAAMVLLNYTSRMI